MLQLNHVTVTRGEREVLSDCTFQFQEGKAYVIISEDAEDQRAFFRCACREKATKRGEIITWDGSVIYNGMDDMFLPRFLTVREYLEDLAEVTEHLTTAGALIKRLGIEEKELGVTIGKSSEKTVAALRLAPIYATDPYVIIFGEPFPDEDLLCMFVNAQKEDKVIILSTTDIKKAGRIASVTDGEVLSMESGDFKTILIGDM